MSRSITVIKDGRETRLAAGELIVARLFESAMRGDPSSRVQVRRLLVELDRRGLLQAPEAAPRRRRQGATTAVSDEARSTMAAHMLVHARLLRRDMVALLEEAYKPVPDGETSFERLCKAWAGSHVQRSDTLFAGFQ